MEDTGLPSRFPQTLTELPMELQSRVVGLLCSSDLLNLTLVSKVFYSMAVDVLYSKIYLNDSAIERSDVYQLAGTWTWLELSDSIKDSDELKEVANEKLKLLLRSFQENIGLMNKVIELRLNWDLDIDLQIKLIYLLSNHSKSLRIIENITNPSLNDALEHSIYRDNLTSLDIPPPFPLPELEMPEDYLINAARFMKARMRPENISNIRNLTIFLEPLLLFNNVFRPSQKLQIESFKLHCRNDAYTSNVYNMNGCKFHSLEDIFDMNYLKVLTIISWYESTPPDHLFLFDQWSAFKNLEDITLIAVTYDDEKISKLIESCNVLKRLKLDFSTPRRETTQDTLIYKAIFKHTKSLEFLDIKVKLTHRIVNLDIRGFKIFVRIPCPCSLCQERVGNEIYRMKILENDPEFKVEHLDNFRAVDFFDNFALSSLSPYAKAVDKFPSVKTGTDDIQDFLRKYNHSNSYREKFIPLDEDDFYDLYHCLIHSLKPDLEPFLKNFAKLKFIVLNDISLIVSEDKKKGFRFPEPLFYHRGFKTNFGNDIINFKTFDGEPTGPTLTLF